ncbi:MAG: site-2 protease family protein [Cyanobacteria bacterium RM1_2_2]|nr:site-2 protease family protein [Cyanobacteria bacterium RM1_2_2]
MITALILFFAVLILGWGFYRARPLGKLGLLAWLQSVALMAPWLTFFGLFAVGVYLNLAGLLFLLLASIGLYIFLGKQLRALAAEKNTTDPLPHLSSEPGEAASASHPATHPTASPAAHSTSTQPNLPASPQTAPASDLPTMPAEDVQTVKGIFGIDTFFATETIPYQNGAIFKGNLRGEPDYSHQRLTDSLTQQMGDRYRLFLVEGVEEKPVVVVLPSANDPKPSTVAQKILALILAFVTVATSLEVAGLMQGFDFSNAPNRIAEVLPIGTGILAILGIHELGHRLLARRYQIRLSPPFLIPTWQLGSFGALMRFESLLPNRSVLFDIAFAGPAAGGLFSFGMLILGLLLSTPGSFFQVPIEFFQGSILVGTLGRVVLGEAIQTELVAVHPLVILGWLGLVITAINVMPAGQLDGGRIVQAIYGRKTAGRTTVATLIVLGLASLVNPLSLYWAIIILFLQRDLERPALNELTEPDDTRAALGLLILFLMAATLLPLTPSLAGRLGIGSS